MPGACSGRSTRRGCAVPAAAPATWPTTTLRSCPSVRAAGRPTRGKRGNRRRSGRSLRAIETCPTRPALADLGRRLYAARLPRAQAGVTWTRYRIRQAALDAAAPLSPGARDMLADIERAETWALPRLGAALYRRQHAAGAPGLTPAEWRRIWAAYRARRPARPA